MTKSIVLAGGCFWAVEHLYRQLPGVLSAHSGYANGRKAEWADYEKVCTGLTGFREAVQVTYDPEAISLRHLLFVFFNIIDPASTGRTRRTPKRYWPSPRSSAPAIPASARSWSRFASSASRRNTTSAIWRRTPAATATSRRRKCSSCAPIPSARRTTPAPRSRSSGSTEPK